MQYQVLIEKPSEQRFVASVVGLSDVVASGETEEEAIVKIRSAIAEKLSKTKVVTVEVETEDEVISASTKKEGGSLMKHVGIFSDDPTFDDFLEEIEKYRKQVDEKTNA